MANLIIGAVITGILTGGVYALMSSGLTLIFGVMEIINIAQGALVILGAYLSYWLQANYHVDLLVGLLITMPIMFLLGLLIEIAFIRPLKHNRTMLSILVTFAIAMIIEGVLTNRVGANYKVLNAWYVDASFKIGNFYLPYIYVFGFLLSVFLLSCLYLLLYRTKFGYSLRASMQNRTAAELIGIDVERVSAITFGIGVALAAAGGVAFGATNLFNPSSHYDLIASVALLVIGDVTAVVWSPVWSSTVFFIILVAVLVIRPQGLFGQPEGRKQ
jgi:branched-chain amino acid transport system permease protein